MSKRARWIVALVGVLAVHGMLLAYFAPEGAFSHPLLFDAYGSNFYHALRMKQGLEAAGVTWVYDPSVNAGRIAGAVRGLGSVWFPASAWVSAELGVGLASSVNTTVVVFSVVVPALGFFAARSFGLLMPGSVICAALWSALWFFDSLVHFTWYSGRIAWALAAAVATLAIGSYFRTSTTWRAAPVTAAVMLGAAAALAHPFVVPLLVVALLGVVFGRHLRPLRAALLGAAPVAVATARWIVEGGASDEPTPVIFASTADQTVTDLFEILSDQYADGGPVRTFFRLLCVAAAVLALNRWGKKDARFAVIAPVIASCFLLSYFGGYAPVAWPIDPYFTSVLLAWLSAVPASAFLAETVTRETLRSMPRLARGACLVLALVAAPRAVRTVLTFMPDSLPDRVLRSPADPHVSALFGINEPLPSARRLSQWPVGYIAVRNTLESVGITGRVAVGDPGLAAFLAVTTRFAVLGLPAERGSAAADGARVEMRSEETLTRFLRRYAVQWVVLPGPPPSEHPEAGPLAFARFVEGYSFYLVRRPSGPFVEGEGELRAVQLNSIRVEGARGDRVVLAFHYHPSLRCRPECAVAPFVGDGERGAFVSVESPPERFEIYADTTAR